MRLPSQDKQQPKNTKITYFLMHFERFPIKIQKSLRGKKEFSVTAKKKRGDQSK